jgi:radical SAM superfamily enzyme YgiQ (UPF0313 family)
MRVGLLYVDDFAQPRSQRVGSLGLGYLAAWLEQEIPGCETEIGIRPEDLIAFQPDIIGISAYTETLPIAIAHAQTLKAALGVPLILGGPHIASNPMALPAPFDVGVVGEGEEVFLALLQAWQHNAFHAQTFAGIQGVTYPVAGQLHNTGRCPDIRDLDKLAHPSRKKMFAAMQRHLPYFDPILLVHTARGCPYRCTFCSAPLVNPKWRFHSPEWVLGELEIIAREFPDRDEITLSDDLFTLKKSRLEELVKAIRSAGFHRRFFFFCSSRSNTLTDDMCRLLREMNVLTISFGLESASDRLSRDLKGVGTTRRDYERVLALCAKHGLYAHGNFITGSQDETLADLHTTYHFIQANADQLASISIAHMTPFPGTKVWDDAVKAQLVDPHTVDYRVLNLNYAPHQSVYLNQHYPEALYETAWKRFVRLETQLNDRYYHELSLLKDIEKHRRYDIPTKLMQTIQHLGWQRVGLLTRQDPWLPKEIAGCEVIVLNPEEPHNWETLALDGLVLYHTLEETRTPEAVLKQLPALPLLVIHYNMANLYELVLLMLGKWEEGVYGLRRRRHLRYFTLTAIKRLLTQEGWQLDAFSPNPFTLPTLDYSVLQPLQAIAPLKDPHVVSYLSLFTPALVAQNAANTSSNSRTIAV